MSTCTSGEPTTLVIDNPSGRGQSSTGLIVEAVPSKGWGTGRLVDDTAGPIGEPVPIFGCVRGAEPGEMVPLHRCSASAAWHVANEGDYPHA